MRRLLGITLSVLINVAGTVHTGRCDECETGWTKYRIGKEFKCIYFGPKLPLNQAKSFCQSLKATVPYPLSRQENMDYSTVLDNNNIGNIAFVDSRVGLVEMKQNGDYNHFPLNSEANVVCEKKIENLACHKKVMRRAANNTNLNGKIKLIFKRTLNQNPNLKTDCFTLKS